MSAGLDFGRQVCYGQCCLQRAQLLRICLQTLGGKGSVAVVKGRLLEVVRSAWRIIKAHRKAYLAVNVGYYGLVAAGMLYVALVDPSLQEQLIGGVQAALTEGSLEMVGSAYLSGNVVIAALVTFLVNLFAGSVLYLTLPSLVVPFAAIPLGAYRALLWGLLLAPTTMELALVMIPHSLTLILEGQAYVLAAFAAYLQGMAFLRPQMMGLTSHREGYVAGLKMTGRVYVLVILVLAVAAVYEAIEVMAMVQLASGLG
jgi:hypothetical protein